MVFSVQTFDRSRGRCLSTRPKGSESYARSFILPGYDYKLVGCPLTAKQLDRDLNISHHMLKN